MNILISTITRNDAHKLDTYYQQVSNIPKQFKEHNFYLSIYENDSSDNTVEKLNSYDFSMFKDYKVVCETLNYPFAESVETEQNISILAECRNKSIFDCGFLDICDQVMVIESDIFFRPRAIRSLLNFNTKHNLDADIVTSMHLWDELSNVLYDTYGTRHTSESIRDHQKDDWKSKEYDEYWATFNGIAYMKAEAFKKGAKYHWFNERFGKVDCDTTIICEEFRKLGFDKIYMDYNSRCYVHKNY
jgi:hypothetical protein